MVTEKYSGWIFFITNVIQIGQDKQERSYFIVLHPQTACGLSLVVGYGLDMDGAMKRLHGCVCLKSKNTPKIHMFVIYIH